MEQSVPSRPPVDLSIQGHVAVVTLDNGERKNVLDEQLACLAAIDSNSVEQNLHYNRLLRAAMDAIAALPMPSVAAVNGHAIGGGLELALACTLRVAAAEAKLGMPEARLGILPGTGGVARLSRLITPSVAARLLLTGDLVDGTEAARLGIVDVAVPAESVLEAAGELADRIATAAPLSTRAIVDALRNDAQLSVEDANVRTEVRLASLLASSDRHEGAQAFLERREPKFSGA
jgi:enoyl-CoA hydratase/carnithine racemase